MNQYQLDCFNKTVEMGSISHAAKMIGISASSLSQTLNRLENELGFILFDRKGGHLKVNIRGERFYKVSHSFLKDLSKIEHIIKQEEQTQEQELTIGIYHESFMFSKCMMSFLRKHPSVNFKILNFADALVAYNKDLPDIAIHNQYLKEKKNSIYLFRDPYFAVLPSSSKLARNEYVLMNQLEEMPFVMMEQRWHHLEKSTNTFDQKLARLMVKYKVDHLGLKQWLIRNRLAIGIMPESELSLFKNKSGLKFVQILDEEAYDDVYLYYNNENMTTETMTAFLIFVSEYYNVDNTLK